MFFFCVKMNCNEFQLTVFLLFSGIFRSQVHEDMFEYLQKLISFRFFFTCLNIKDKIILPLSTAIQTG